METKQPGPYTVQRGSRFQLVLVDQTAALLTYGDVCKQTCKTPLPNTCKLECHSGSPFTDMQEAAPEAPDSFGDLAAKHLRDELVSVPQASAKAEHIVA